MKYAWSCRWLLSSGLLVAGSVVAMLSSGCGGSEREGWYDESSARSTDQETYVQDQMILGVSREDAVGTYARNVYWEATEGKDQKIVIDGKELEHKVTRP